MQFVYFMFAVLFCKVCAICENPADTFHCDNTRRIPCSKWRDGNYSDCGGNDYSDEIHTKACTVPYYSSSGTFNCENAGGKTIPCSQFRDGTRQCTGTGIAGLDGADEFCTQKTDQYTCRNGTQISCYLFQDGKNDCGDNSDEGVLYNCQLKTINGITAYNFKCTMRNGFDDYSSSLCQAWFFQQDGSPECLDMSDEAILIGDACSHRSSWIQCRDLISGSSCVNNKCVCDDGKMAVNSGSRCLTRTVDDPCTKSRDCTASMAGMDCGMTSHKCYCLPGYDVYNPNGNDVMDGSTICNGTAETTIAATLEHTTFSVMAATIGGGAQSDEKTSSASTSTITIAILASALAVTLVVLGLIVIMKVHAKRQKCNNNETNDDNTAAYYNTGSEEARNPNITEKSEYEDMKTYENTTDVDASYYTMAGDTSNGNVVTKAYQRQETENVQKSVYELLQETDSQPVTNSTEYYNVKAEPCYQTLDA